MMSLDVSIKNLNIPAYDLMLCANITQCLIPNNKFLRGMTISPPFVEV